MARNITSFDDQLLHLIENKGDLERIKKLVAEKNLYNVSDKKKNTLLHYAVRYDNIQVLQYLISSGSKLNALDDRGRSPLILSIHKISNQGEITAALINAGATIYASKKGVQSALEVIGQSETASKQVLRHFLKKLKSNCSNDREKIAKKLFDAKWPLTQVVQLEDAELTEFMLRLKHAAKINKDVDSSRKTALHIAVEGADVENVKVLLKYKANVNAVDSLNKTPLSYLYEHDAENNLKENFEILKMLLKRIGNDFIEGRYVYNILRYANKEAIKLLFQYNIYRTTYGSCHSSVVHILALNQNPDVIAQLKYQEFNINARNYQRRTPLMYATAWGNTNAVECLLNEGAKINAKDYRGQTALFVAIDYAVGRQEQVTECVQILLERGADIEIDTGNPDTPTETIFHKILTKKTFILGNFIVSYLAFQKAKGISISPSSKYIYGDQCFKNIFELSMQQLEMKIYESISLFDLLTATEKKLDQLAYHEYFPSKVEEFIVSNLSENHYFTILLRKRIMKAIDAVKLKREAALAFSKMLDFGYERFPHVVSKIVQSLEDQEMKNLTEAVA